MATAALLIEMSFQDERVDELEVASVKASIIKNLNLSEDEAEKLYVLAEEAKNKATDYHQFTKLIAENFTQSKKVELIEALWRVAFADKTLDKYEENMVRRISDLIHVSHKDFIRAKHRAESMSLQA